MRCEKPGRVTSLRAATVTPMAIEALFGSAARSAARCSLGAVRVGDLPTRPTAPRAVAGVRAVSSDVRSFHDSQITRAFSVERDTTVGPVRAEEKRVKGLRRKSSNQSPEVAPGPPGIDESAVERWGEKKSGLQLLGEMVADADTK